jgi:2-(1,2-epoxy-1,2-dihydrophenyl)acetyl-CoA isomerase
MREKPRNPRTSILSPQHRSWRLDMPDEVLTLDIHDHIATLRMNRPDAYNAVNEPLARQFLELITQVDEDPAVRCVVLTGAGKAFCAGGDVKDFHDHLPQVGVHLKRLTHLLHGAVSRIARMPKPVIAAVNGVVAGGGMGLMLACDLAYAVETATLSMAYTRIGANPNGSSTFWLPRLVGVRRALELIYTNRLLSAREALAWGILNGVMPPERFPDEVYAVARQLAQGPTLAYARAKQLCYTSLNETLETHMEHEARAIADSGKTEDFREGIQAFMQKRAAAFQGR